MVKVIVLDCVEGWEVTIITAGKDGHHEYSHINMCQEVCTHPTWCFWGSRCAGICPTGAAQLLSPHYPLWTRTDIISFSVSLSTFTSPRPLLHHLSPMSFFIFVYLNLLLFLFFPSFLSARLPPVSGVIIPVVLLGDTACHPWFCGSGLLTATGSKRQVWQGWGSQSGK